MADATTNAAQSYIIQMGRRGTRQRMRKSLLASYQPTETSNPQKPEVG